MKRRTPSPNGNDFIVLVENDERLVRHDTLAEAEAEARRLARLDPGKNFRVFAAKSEFGFAERPAKLFNGEYAFVTGPVTFVKMDIPAAREVAARAGVPSRPRGKFTHGTFEFTGEFRYPRTDEWYAAQMGPEILPVRASEDYGPGFGEHWILRGDA